MDMFGIGFRKEFGQNFLTDRSVVEDIADSCCPDGECTVLEIGPGIGTLTYELCLRHREVLALEIDTGLIPVLAHTLEEFDNVTVLNQDVMQADLESLLAPYFAKGKVCVCANLPYYITSPILMKLLESGLPFESITVMIQAEVADRLCAAAGKRDYGAITAAVNYYGSVERLLDVPADRFVPAPKVNSAVIRINLYGEHKPCRPKDEAMLFRTIKAAFGQRRKTLLNALSTGFPQLSREEITNILNGCGHETNLRGERLSIEEFTALSDAIGSVLAQKQE
jgi:16S rRNA (adenine1518-N6/adenine1519-N6)-dimethyltransferase